MNQNIQRSNFIIGFVLMTVFLAILIGYTNSRIIAKYPITKDAQEYTSAAFYLKSKGIISNDGVNPSMFREPLTIAILALHMKLMTDIPDEIDNIEELTHSPYYVKQINKVNLIYIVGGMFMLWICAYSLTKSHIFSAILIYLSWSTFYIQSWYLYRPLTEYAASFFLILIGYLSLIVFREVMIKKRLVFSLGLGIAIGLLALTKAVALYVAIVYVPIFATALLLSRKLNLKSTLLTLMTIVLGLSLVVSPWIYRNSALGSEASIAGRGGSVLLGRSKLNQNISKDMLGGLYVFSPPMLQQAFFEKVLGFEARSLAAGGKYAYLNRNVGFKNKPNQSAYKAFNLAPEKEKESYRSGISNIADNVLPHVMTTGVMAWRGLWSFDGGNHLVPGGKTKLSVVFNLIGFCAFILFPVISLFKKRIDWFVLSLFPAGFFWIYASFSHFIPRYSAPLIPITILTLLLLFQHTVLATFAKLKLSRNKKNGT